MVVIWFITYGIGGLLCFPLADKIGRRRTAIIFATGHFLAMAMIIFHSGIMVRFIGFGLMGFLHSTKSGVCYSWLFEFHTKKYKATAATTLNFLEFLTSMLGGIYFLLISQDWAPFILWVYFFNLAGFIILLFCCPESPYWLLMQGKEKEAIEALNYIAWFNRSDRKIPEETEFIEARLAKHLPNTDSYS